MKQKLQRGNIIEGIVSCEDYFADTPFWRIIFLQYPEKFGVLPVQENVFPGQTIQVEIRKISGHRLSCVLPKRSDVNGKVSRAS